ncbi:MAG: prepilin-type N-terminal cleavage/methylation domain-containing protein [Opitutaceae bacterium]|nr:prepilin-type N-terminal cleavage/methylation domain-containing protein [Opitutaceae bacterium]
MRRNSPAFTVLEVLMALAIFALMATVIAASYLNVLRAYQLADSDGLSESRLRHARSEFFNTTARDDVLKGSNFTDGDVRVEWSGEIEPTAVPDLYRVTFQFTEKPGQEKAPVRTTEVHWLFRPGWAQPMERGPIELRFREAVQERLEEEDRRR